MEISMWVYAFLISLFLLVMGFKFSPKSKIRKLPPSPAVAIPVIGHLHLLKSPLHRTYYNLSRKVGPVFSLRLGTRTVVVVSSPAVADKCFTKNDVVLANRPRFLFSKYIGYNHTSPVGAPYGDYWRTLRRLMMGEIFSSARLNAFQPIRQDEAKRMLVKLMMMKKRRNSNNNSNSNSHDFGRVELRSVLTELTFNNIMRMVAGKRYFGEEEKDEEALLFRGFMKEALTYATVSNPGDVIPVFRWIDYRNYEKNLATLSGKMDSFLQSLIEEQRRNKGRNTMINHLLNLQDKEPQYYTDQIIKGIVMIMLLAGTDTSSVTIEWAMCALLNHPEKLKKARAEVDKIIGNDRLMEESDIHNLPYLESVISETFRLFPAGPLLVPHEASDDCEIAGYDIPRGTIVIINAWAIHRDPTVWDDPQSFKPERFEGGGEIGAPPKLMPFGMGRRACPGMGLGQRFVGLGLGLLIQCFEWKRIDEALVDLTEGKGVSMPKATPLEAMCKVRDVLCKVLPEQV